MKGVCVDQRKRERRSEKRSWCINDTENELIIGRRRDGEMVAGGSARGEEED